MTSRLCLPLAAYAGIPIDELQERYDTTLRALLEEHAPSRTARHRCQPTTPGSMQTVPRPSAKQGLLNGGIRGRSWILICWCGLGKPGRNNDCSPRNKISSGIRKFLTARVISRNHGGIFRVLYERFYQNLRIQASSLQSVSRMPSRN